MRIQDNNKLYFKTQNDLNHEMLHDICAPSSRITSKAENSAEIRKLIIKTFKSE